MPDKKRERYHFEAFRSAFPQFPTGSVEEKEPPDFLVRTASGSLGVEFTTLHVPPPTGKRPHQEQQSLKERIVAIAQEMHRARDGKALYVSVFFAPDRALSKRGVPIMSQSLAELILGLDVPSSLAEPSLRASWGDVPEGINSILIHGSIDGKDRLWHADAGGWVAPVGPDLLATVVQAKDSQAARARAECDEVWLVVVNDQFSRAAPAELSAEAEQVPYATGFDRLFWLVPHTPFVQELRKE